MHYHFANIVWICAHGVFEMVWFMKNHPLFPLNVDGCSFGDEKKKWKILEKCKI